MKSGLDSTGCCNYGIKIPLKERLDLFTLQSCPIWYAPLFLFHVLFPLALLYFDFKLSVS